MPRPEQLPPVLATGAWLKSAACRLDGDGASWSPLHGKLDDPSACAALERSVNALLDGAARPVQAIAHDLHPDFFSTRLALRLAAERGVPAIGVQHHVAHVAAVVAEHGLDEPVVGLALDGFGLGTDGAAWGGELLALDGARWQRLGHLWRLALPGGDAAAREPWRMAAAGLHALGRGGEIATRFVGVVPAATTRKLAQMLDRGLNCPHTTSAGRWFDAAAGALGVSLRQAHEAEAAIALERLAAQALADGVSPRGLPAIDAEQPGPLDLRPLLAWLLAVGEGDDPGAAAEGAAGFHLALADALADWAAATARRLAVRGVCLGGGCFLNTLLSTRLSAQLQRHGLAVHRPQAQSCGDAGLALGQAWVAAQQLRHGPAGSTTPLPPESPPCA